MNSRPALVVFDLDGTLVDSREDIARACNHALVAHGRDALPASVIHTFVGDGARLLVARAFGLDPTAREVDAPLAAFHAFYVEHAYDTTTLLPHARELITQLAAFPVHLAICTNKPRATSVSVLAGLGVRDAFGFVFAGGDGPLKPDPTGILACCKHFGVTVEATWMVGDGPQDIESGKNARVRTVGVATGLFAPAARLAASAPDVTVESLQDLAALTASLV